MMAQIYGNKKPPVSFAFANLPVVEYFQTYLLLFARLRSCFLFSMFFCTCFFKMLVIFIAQVLIRVAINNKCADEPDEKHQRNYNSHDHVPDLITEVHEDGNNVKCLGKRKDHDNTFDSQNQC